MAYDAGTADILTTMDPPFPSTFDRATREIKCPEGWSIRITQLGEHYCVDLFNSHLSVEPISTRIIYARWLS